MTVVCSVGIAFWAKTRMRSNEDFFLGWRALGPVVRGISYSCSASSAFALLGLSGASYVLGPVRFLHRAAPPRHYLRPAINWRQNVENAGTLPHTAER